jgi:hypothetical protein
MELPQKIKDSLRTVLDYNWDERSNYAEWCETGRLGGTHIYEHVALVKLWLETPELSVEEVQSVVNQRLEELRRRHAAWP